MGIIRIAEALNRRCYRTKASESRQRKHHLGVELGGGHRFLNLATSVPKASPTGAGYNHTYTKAKAKVGITWAAILVPVGFTLV